MEPIGGDLAEHDHEFDEVRWIAFDTAATMLTFETERALVAARPRSSPRTRGWPARDATAAEAAS